MASFGRESIYFWGEMCDESISMEGNEIVIVCLTYRFEILALSWRWMERKPFEYTIKGGGEGAE